MACKVLVLDLWDFKLDLPVKSFLKSFLKSLNQYHCLSLSLPLSLVCLCVCVFLLCSVCVRECMKEKETEREWREGGRKKYVLAKHRSLKSSLKFARFKLTHY